MRNRLWAYFTTEYLSLVSLIRLPIIAMVISVAVAFALCGYLGLETLYERSNQNFRDTIRERYKVEIQHIVETVASAIESTMSGRVGPELSSDQQEAVKRIIRGAKFELSKTQPGVWNGYVFLYDTEGRCLAHGFEREREGKAFLEFTDEDGRALVKQLRDQAQQGGGFVEYKFRKPDEPAGTFPKISYAKSLRGGQWWLGAGVYADDVEHVIVREREKQDVQRTVAVGLLFVLSGLLMLVFLYIGLIVSRTTSQPIVKRMQALSRAADEERLLFAGDLHNKVGQMVVQIKQKLAEITGLPDEKRRQTHADECSKYIDDFSEYCSKTLHNIYPLVLDHGVSTAFAYFLKEVRASTSVQFARQIHEVPPSDSGRERALYLIGQGLVQNVLNHAEASLIDVTLAYQAERVMLRVEDNGRGFHPDAVLKKESIGQSRFGLPWIVAQVEMYEGKVKLNSSPGLGTIAEITMPWPTGVTNVRGHASFMGDR